MTLVQQTLNRGLLAHLDAKEWDPITTLTDLTTIVNTKTKFSGPQLMCLAANLVSIGKRIKADKIDVIPNHIPEKFQNVVECLYTTPGSFETSFGDRQTYIYVLCGIYLELYDVQFNTVDSGKLSGQFVKALMMTERASKTSGIVDSIRKKINGKPQGYSVGSLIVNPIHRGDDAFVPTLLTTDCYYMDSTMLLKSLTDDRIPMLIVRIKNHLTSPLYWEKVKPLYVEIFKNKTRDYNTIKALIKEGLSDIIKIPFTPDEFHQLTPVAWKIWCMPPVLRAYYLGFPIHLGTFNDASCKAAIMKYVTMGFRDYAKHMGHLGTSLIRPPLDHYGLIEYQSIDDDDLNGDTYESYSPFDRIAYIEESRVYEFTRRGFEHLLVAKVNPYNKTKLVTPLMMTLNQRRELVSAYNLPPCRPLKDLYVSLGEQLTSEEVKELGIPPQTSTTVSPPTIIDYGRPTSTVRGQMMLNALAAAGIIHEVPVEPIRGILVTTPRSIDTRPARTADSTLRFLSNLLENNTIGLRPVLDSRNGSPQSEVPTIVPVIRPTVTTPSTVGVTQPPEGVITDEVAMVGDALMSRFLGRFGADRTTHRQVTIDDYSRDSDDDESDTVFASIVNRSQTPNNPHHDEDDY
jgi:hypothetical protein